MTIPAILAALLAAQVPANAPIPTLSPEAQAALRCSAAFALVSYGQERGDESSAKWPDLDARGREFFVRVMAQLIDETGLDREQVAEMAKVEAQRLLDANEVDQVMPACLTMLENSGL
ncbi:MAG: hypothetical protein EP350_05760 [Alphaproteobacteria bacterium]|nr:MAG: hypothetical protein EP350_05760 [Alphaproteobacteria bacterium]